MKISSETIQILKNFTTINPGIMFRKGNVISTISIPGNILGVAKVEEEFPVDFGIYDLNNFLSVISLYKDGCELEFDSKHIIIKGLGGRSKVTYRVTDETMLKVPPGTNPKFPSIDVEFELTQEDLNWIIRTAGVLSSTHIAIDSDGEDVYLITYDAENDSAHTNSVKLDITATTKYRLVFKTENLKLIPGNYTVQICSKGISKFEEKNKQITYYIALESKYSKYE
jgi:hypothetical protein